MFRLRTVCASIALGTLTLAAVRPVLLQEHMEMPKPTKEHAELQMGVGEWEGTITMFHPGMPATPSPAKETVRAQGPFWLTSDFQSEFMGMAYTGHGCHGYDASKGKYVSTWIDNMSSLLMVMEGEIDPKTKMLVMNWQAPDMTGKVVPHRSETVHSADAYTMTFFTDGTKSMVIDMKRAMAKAGKHGPGDGHGH